MLYMLPVQPDPAVLLLYPFKFLDPLSGRWVRARYRAERHEIAARYAEYEITGPPELRDVDPEARYFNPLRDERRSMENSVANLGTVHAISRPTARWLIPVCGVAT